MITCRFEIPIRVNNPLNGAQYNWRAKAAVRKQARKLAQAFCRNSRMPKDLPATIILTRCGPNKRPMDETDGLRAALKSVVDGIADYLGVDDADGRIEWQYRQRREKEYGVMVEMLAGVRQEGGRV